MWRKRLRSFALAFSNLRTYLPCTKKENPGRRLKIIDTLVSLSIFFFSFLLS